MNIFDFDLTFKTEFMEDLDRIERAVDIECSLAFHDMQNTIMAQIASFPCKGKQAILEMKFQYQVTRCFSKMYTYQINIKYSAKKNVQKAIFYISQAFNMNLIGKVIVKHNELVDCQGLDREATIVFKSMTMYLLPNTKRPRKIKSE